MLPSASEDDNPNVHLLFECFQSSEDGLEISEHLSRHGVESLRTVQLDVEDVIVFHLADDSLQSYSRHIYRY